MLRAPSQVVTYLCEQQLAKVRLTLRRYKLCVASIRKKFGIEWNTEKIFRMEWKIFSMEGKKIASIEYRKIVFHSILCPGLRFVIQESVSENRFRNFNKLKKILLEISFIEEMRTT